MFDRRSLSFTCSNYVAVKGGVRGETECCVRSKHARGATVGTKIEEEIVLL